MDKELELIRAHLIADAIRSATAETVKNDFAGSDKWLINQAAKYAAESFDEFVIGKKSE